MTVSRGKIHKYLGMTLDDTVRGQVKITMFDYVDEILTAFDKAEPKVGGTNTSEAPDSLSRLTRAAQIWLRTRLWSSTTWWRKLCMPPSGQGRIPSPRYHS
jgi:hypothetical protein